VAGPHHTAPNAPWPKDLLDRVVPEFRSKWPHDNYVRGQVYQHSMWSLVDSLLNVALLWIDVRHISCVDPHCPTPDVPLNRHQPGRDHEYCEFEQGWAHARALQKVAEDAWGWQWHYEPATGPAPDVYVVAGFGKPWGPNFPALGLLPADRLAELLAKCETEAIAASARASGHGKLTEMGRWTSRINWELVRRAREGEPRFTWDQGFSWNPDDEKRTAPAPDPDRMSA